MSTRHHCSKTATWLDQFRGIVQDDDLVEVESRFGELLWPLKLDAPEPHEDLKGAALEIFEEARRVLPHSTRATAALLRLALDHFLHDQLDCKPNSPTSTIDQKIAELKVKGVHEDVIRTADLIRLYGNDAVHPSEIKFDEDPSIADELFSAINLFVDETVGRQKRLERHRALIPEDKRKVAEERDEKILKKHEGKIQAEDNRRKKEEQRKRNRELDRARNAEQAEE
ncbi:MAG: DUF4145 domain-containing protein [Planctomycetota bacterium]